MKSKPNISVVINVRNEAEHLNRCLKSIKDLANEIVIVDMKSTDNSVAIAKNYGAYGIELYVACLLIYWGLSLVIEQAFLRMESYLDRGRLKA